MIHRYALLPVLAAALIAAQPASAQDIRTIPGARQPAAQPAQPSSKSYGPPAPIETQLRDTPPEDPPAPRTQPVPTVAPVVPTRVTAPVRSEPKREPVPVKTTRPPKAAASEGAADPAIRPAVPAETLPSAPTPTPPTAGEAAPTIPLPTNSPNPAPELSLPQGTVPAPRFEPMAPQARPADAAWTAYWPWAAAGLVALALIGWLSTRRRGVALDAYADTRIEPFQGPRPVEAEAPAAPLGYVPPRVQQPAEPKPVAPQGARVAADGRITSSRLRAPEPMPAAEAASDGRIVSNRLKASPAPPASLPPPERPAGGYQLRSARVGYGLPPEKKGGTRNRNG